MGYYNFDEVIPRKGTNCAKWDGYERKFANYDVKGALGMWIADMDFPCPKEVVTAINNRAKHGIYGYPSEDAIDAFKRAASGWFDRQYGLVVDTEWMIFIAGVVPSLNVAIQEFTQPGDGVIIQPPVYYPFSSVIRDCNRLVKTNRLIEENGYYRIDFENLEKLARKMENKLFILCSPHNPVGRVWKRDELIRLGEICRENNLLMISDEIHADFIMKENSFISAGNLSSEIRNNLILTFSPSKTFNLAGLGASIIVIENEEIRNRFKNRVQINNYPDSNIFGPIGGEAAYLYGDDYKKELNEYIESNFDYTVKFCKENFKKISLRKPEGTYLAWLDFRGTELKNEEIISLVLEKAKIAIDPGDWFGSGGEGFVRMNMACPRSIVVEAMDRLKNAIDNE